MWLALAGLALALVVCAGIRVWLIQHSVMIARDGVAYIQIARDWQRDPMGVLKHCPLHVGYPVAICGVHHLLRGFDLPEGLRGWEPVSYTHLRAHET